MAEFNSIGNIDIYNTRMEKGMIDKLFFVDKIDADVVVDFGCANGSLIRHLSQWIPDAEFVGYDNDPEMIKLALKAFKAKKSQFSFTIDWSNVAKMVERANASGKRVAIVLSSIVHEVYHYQQPPEIDLFWKRIFGSGFDFIVIRDMIPSRSIDRVSDINDVARVLRKFAHTQQLQDFQNAFGSIENNRNLIHFLLKYKYQTPNWDREVKENYLPLCREDLLAMIPNEYHVAYHHHYILPYTRRSVRSDVGIDLKDPTHLKAIFEK